MRRWVDCRAVPRRTCRTAPACRIPLFFSVGEHIVCFPGVEHEHGERVTNDMEKSAGPAPKVSVVVPMYNEVGNAAALYAELVEVLDAAGVSYELIFVDDGSTDGTLEALKAACAGDEGAQIVELRRNYGKSAALNAGFDIARGEAVVTLDGDRQNDPHDIPALLKKLDEGQGYDVVSGWRTKRQENLMRRFPSHVANGLISRITGVHLHDYGCCLKAYRREVLRDIKLYGEMHRFIPALVRWVGGRVTELPVNDRPRTAGKTKFGRLGRTAEVILDLMTVKFMMHYLTKPIYFFGRIGLLLLFMAFTVLGIVIVQKLCYGADMTGNPLLYLSVTFVILGVLVVLMGLMMELLTRTYHESQGRKMYAIRAIHRGRRGQSDER